MYQEFYGLKQNPFRLNPDPAFLCLTAQHREALAGLVYSACTRPGLTVLVGEAGTGKTTLLFALLEMLTKRRFVTAMCTNPTLTRAEFYDLVLAKFGIEIPSGLKSRQLIALQEMLLRNRADGRPSLLIVDEAQRLSPELLEEIRLLLNTETPSEKLLEIIIAGQPELLDVLRRPDMRQLKQRVSCVCKLRPLNRDEIHQYLQHRLTQAGLPAQTLFSGSLIEVIYRYTRGIPRLVNILCDSSLRTGFALQSTRITRFILDEAARDLDLAGVHAGSSLSAQSPEEDGEPVPAVAEPEKSSASFEENGINGNSVSRGRNPQDQDGVGQGMSFFFDLMDRWR